MKSRSYKIIQIGMENALNMNKSIKYEVRDNGTEFHNYRVCWDLGVLSNLSCTLTLFI